MTDSESRPEEFSDAAPAYYAKSHILHRRVLGDWWTLLHPPYTLWHLSYVVFGACLTGPVNVTYLLATLLAFASAVGISAHALDELRGRPLRTQLSNATLICAATIGLLIAGALGIVGVVKVGAALAIFIVIGVLLVCGYNLELFGGRLHNNFVFAAGWGAFPVLTAYYAQHHNLSVASLGVALFALLLSRAQRELSTPARLLRRRTRDVSGFITLHNGDRQDVTITTLLGPLESALQSLSWATVVLAIGLAFARLHVA